MRVGVIMSRSLRKRLRALDFMLQHKVTLQTVVLVTKELNNGTKHARCREDADVEESVGKAYEKAIWHNRHGRDTATERILRTILAREELRVR